jgi:hypothetical protein
MLIVRQIRKKGTVMCPSSSSAIASLQLIQAGHNLDSPLREILR